MMKYDLIAVVMVLVRVNLSCSAGENNNRIYLSDSIYLSQPREITNLENEKEYQLSVYFDFHKKEYVLYRMAVNSPDRKDIIVPDVLLCAYGEIAENVSKLYIVSRSDRWTVGLSVYQINHQENKSMLSDYVLIYHEEDAMENNLTCHLLKNDHGLTIYGIFDRTYDHIRREFIGVFDKNLNYQNIYHTTKNIPVLSYMQVKDGAIVPPKLIFSRDKKEWIPSKDNLYHNEVETVTLSHGLSQNETESGAPPNEGDTKTKDTVAPSTEAMANGQIEAEAKP